MTDAANTVLVSGGSGYIAGFLIRQLVTEGWMVHTTVRSLAKEAAVRELLALDNSRLQALIGKEPHTPLGQAARQALVDLRMRVDVAPALRAA